MTQQDVVKPEVLALDIMRKCGWAARVGNKVQAGVWQLWNLKRYETIYTGMRALRERLKATAPRRVVIEHVQGQWQGLAAGEQWQRLHAVVMEYCRDNEIPLRGYHQTEIKKIVTGKGNASKKDMTEAVSRRYPWIDVYDDNQADALGVMLADEITEQQEAARCAGMFPRSSV